MRHGKGRLPTCPAAIAAAKADAERTGEPLAKAAAVLDYDVADAFASGAWLDELAAAASGAGVVLVRRDGRVTAYPVALRLDARAQGVRIGRKLERRIRPSFVAAQLKALQQRPERFNARQFLDRLFALYESKARAEDPTWRPTRPGQGPLVSLADLHDLLTLLPAAGADYPQEEFVADLLRLDRQPDATDRQRAPLRTRRLHRAQGRQATDPVRRDRRAARLLRHPLHPGTVRWTS